MFLKELQESWNDIISKYDGENSSDEIYSEYHELYHYAIMHGFKLCEDGKTWELESWGIEC